MLPSTFVQLAKVVLLTRKNRLYSISFMSFMFVFAAHCLERFETDNIVFNMLNVFHYKKAKGQTAINMPYHYT